MCCVARADSIRCPRNSKEKALVTKITAWLGLSSRMPVPKHHAGWAGRLDPISTKQGANFYDAKLIGRGMTISRQIKPYLKPDKYRGAWPQYPPPIRERNRLKVLVHLSWEHSMTNAVGKTEESWDWLDDSCDFLRKFFQRSHRDIAKPA